MIKKMSEKFFALFLTLVMVISLLPALSLPAKAADPVIIARHATAGSYFKFSSAEVIGADNAADQNGIIGFYRPVKTGSPGTFGDIACQPDTPYIGQQGSSMFYEQLNGMSAQEFYYFIADTEGTYTFKFLFSDDYTGIDETFDVTLIVDPAAPLNTAPTVTATGTNPTFTENGSLVDLFSGINAGTNDSNQTFSGMTLTVSNVTDSSEHLYINGIDVNLVNGSGSLSVGSYTVAVSSNTATVTVSGMTLSDAQMGTLIGGITYKNNSENPSTANRVIKITGITDSGSSNNSATPNITSTVSITAVNDAPTIKTNAGLTVDEASTNNIIAKSNLEISDVDNAATAITYTLTAVPANGTLKKSGSALAVSGTFTQDDINNNKITYTHDGSETTNDNFKFTVSDGAAGLAETTFAITVTPVNDTPTVNTPDDVNYEDTAASNTFTNTTGKLSASDVDGSISYYGISGDIGGSFEYNGVTYNCCKLGTYGKLYVKSVTGDYLFVPNGTAINAVSANQSETFTVTATDTGDAMGNNQMTGNATLTVKITGANDTPTNIALNNASVNQSTGTNATVGSLSTTDADSDQNYTYTLVKGAGTDGKDNALFDISGTSLLARDTKSIAPGTYNVNIRTTDNGSGNLSFEKVFAITVADDVAPTVSSVAVPADGTYRDGNVLNFTVNFSEPITVVGTPSIALTIDSKTEYATYTPAVSTATALVFQYTVQSGDDSKGNGIVVGALALNGGSIQDAIGNNATLTLNSVGSMTNVKVDAVAPTAPTIQSLSTATDTGISSIDAVTQSTTPTFTGKAEADSTVTLYDTDGTTILGSAIANGSGNWSLSSATLSAGKHTVTAKAADAAGNVSPASGAFVVVIDTTAPSITNSAATTISKSTATNGATAFSLTATDETTIPGFTDALEWSVSGGTDAGKFSTSGNNLVINNAGGLSNGTYTIEVTAKDTAGNTNAKTLTITVVSGPTVTAVNLSYDDTAANDTFGNTTGTISATASSGSITVYGISGAASGSYLSGAYDRSKIGTYGTLYVNSSTGAYVYVPTSDSLFNSQTSTVTDTFTIQATNSAATSGNTLTVTITGVNDTPSFTKGSDITVLEDCEAQSFAGWATALSAGTTNESGQTLSFTVSNSNNALFSAQPAIASNGTLTFTPAANANGSATVTVSVHDDGGTSNGGVDASASQTFTITVTSVNDAPSFAKGSDKMVLEDCGAQNFAGWATALSAGPADESGQTLSFTVSNDNNALFSAQPAVASSGTLTFTPAANANGTATVTVSVHDNGGIANGGVDASALQTFTITVTSVNDAPIISTNAAISVVEGSTAAFTAAATDPEGSSITWSITGGADAAKFSIVPGTGVVTFAAAPSFGAPTDADGKNDYELEITASDGTLLTAKTIKVTVTQKPATGGGAPADTSKPVIVNNQPQDAGTSNTQTVDGQKVTTVTVDPTKLDKILDSSGEKPTVTLPGSTGSASVVGELTGQTVKNMEKKEAVLEIKTETVTYTLPASQINIDSVSSQIGSQVELKDIKVNVKIAEPAADTVKVVEDTASKGNYLLVVKPIEFDITCTSGGKTVEVSKFNGYVERTVAIPDGVDPKKITTGIVLNSDGTFSHVPTQITVINGKYYAKINSLTNSTYSVIWNPVTFTDVANHWSKDAVNDMGSRMVVNGMGNGTYEPDRSITRAEFAAIVVRAMGLKKGTTESAFGDVSASDWFNGYVDTATDYSLITGYDSASYGPNDTITREQAMAILARAMKKTGLYASLTDSEVNALLANYTDGASVSAYAKAAAALCIKTGVVSGSSATTLSPKSYVTRAEVAVMVQRLLQKSGLI